MRKKLFILTIALAICAMAKAQPSDIGAVKSYKIGTHAVEGKTESARFEVKAYDENTVRVRVTQNPAGFRDFSYMLTAEVEKMTAKNVSISQKNGVIYLKTPKIEARISCKPSFLIAFYDTEGRLLNADEPGKGFGTSFYGGRVTSYKSLQPGERFVGLGEALGNLDRRGSVVKMQNTDTFNYGDPRLPMYTNVPFYMGILEDRCYGIFYHNSYEGTVNFGAGNMRCMTISHEGGDADYFFFHDDSPAKILEAYTAVTGRSPLPPLWSLGFHQSRCSYYTEAQVRELARAFRSKQIPLDCIVLDADYLVDYKPFVINEERFPDMAKMAADLKDDGIRLTASVNPGISTDNDYAPLHSAIEEDVLLKYADGTRYVAPIDPNINCYVDYTLPEGRQWWKKMMKVMAANGISGYWNDMNEPAVSESVVPDNVCFDFDGHHSSAMEAKNLFGMLMARSSYEAGLQNVANERPFVLTRSGFAGVQRYSGVWTGDNTAKSDHLLLANLLNSQMGLSGIPFTGADIGGFIGDGNKDLYTRWIQSGVFSAFVRAHRIAFASGNEPWSYGEIPEGIAKTYIGLRYKLLPYIYSSFKETTRNGMPLTRSLCFTDPYDSRTYDSRYQYEFLFGPSMLVVPVIPEENSTPMFLPEGEWYDIYTDKVLNGSIEMSQAYPEYELPLFIKSSSIIPMQSVVQSTMETPSDTLYIHLYNGKESSSFDYYEDDGISFNYRNGEFHSRKMLWSDGKLTLGKAQGNMDSRFTKFCIILHGFSDDVNVVSDGKNLALTERDIRLFAPTGDILCYFEKSLRIKAEAQCKPLIGKCFTMDYKNSEIKILISE